MPKIEIIKDSKTGNKRIFINGKDFSELVVALDVRETTDSIGTVMLELVPSEIHIYEGALG